MPRIRSDWTSGPCEFSVGWEAEFASRKPTVRLCGQPGTARKGVMWCEVYACDECYARWLSTARTRTREHGDDRDG